MNTEFFSLNTPAGTARSIVYWDRFNEQQKSSILFTAPIPDIQLLEIVLQEGNPLLIEIAFRRLMSSNPRRSTVEGFINLVPKAVEAIEDQWIKRLGYSPWSAERCPLNLASDFYTWMRGDSTEGPCAALEAWADKFCLQSQLQRKVQIEPLHTIDSIGILAACLSKRKLSCFHAYDLFKVAIAQHLEGYEEGEGWHFTYDDGVVLSSFLSAMAATEENFYCEDWSLLAGCISALPRFVITEESVEPFLTMHSRSLTSVLLWRGIQLVI